MATKAEVRELEGLKKDMEYMQKDVKEIKETLKTLPEQLKAIFDERYASSKDMEDVKETIEPFTNFRKQLWGGLVFIVLSLAVIEGAVIYFAKGLFDKG